MRSEYKDASIWHCVLCMPILLRLCHSESEIALKKEVLEKDAELERVSREKDEKLQAQAEKIKELEALLASKQ